MSNATNAFCVPTNSTPQGRDEYNRSQKPENKVAAQGAGCITTNTICTGSNINSRPAIGHAKLKKSCPTARSAQTPDIPVSDLTHELCTGEEYPTEGRAPSSANRVVCTTRRATVRLHDAQTCAVHVVWSACRSAY